MQYPNKLRIMFNFFTSPITCAVCKYSAASDYSWRRGTQVVGEFLFMPHVQLKKYPNHFISSAGYVFKIENGKERELKARKAKRSKKVFVMIERKEYELVNLMMEYFEISSTPYDKIYYTFNSEGRIPLSSIRIKQFLNKTELSENDEKLMFKYCCDIKSNAANARATEKITPVQVFYSLKIHDFRCVYCGISVQYNNWHLDHFSALSKSGKNVFENIVPSCSSCNIAKGALDGNQFYKLCKAVSENYKFK